VRLKRAINLVLRASCQSPHAAKQAVLIQFEASMHGDLPQRDVVRLGAGGIAGCGAEARFTTRATASYRVKQFRRFRWFCGYDNVDIPDCLAPPAVAARHLRLAHARDLPQRG
jgi:hypothetical protein